MGHEAPVELADAVILVIVFNSFLCCAPVKRVAIFVLNNPIVNAMLNLLV